MAETTTESRKAKGRVHQKERGSKKGDWFVHSLQRRLTWMAFRGEANERVQRYLRSRRLRFELAQSV